MSVISPRIVATLFLAVAIAIVVARQSPARANAFAGMVGGVLLIALVVADTWRHSRVAIADILLLQTDVRDVSDAGDAFLMMLGYGFVLGAIAAMPWMKPSTASEIRDVLFAKRPGKRSWRDSLARHLLGWLALVLILLLWRWIGWSYYHG